MWEPWPPRRGRPGYPPPYVPACAFLSTLSQRHREWPDYATRPVRSSTGGLDRFRRHHGRGDARGGMAKQDRQSAPLPKRESAAYARRRGSHVAARRGDRWSEGRYVAAYRRLLARHKRLIRRICIGGGTAA